MQDIIVVGARHAGAPTAMLLARKGYRVLLVDRSTFPSDIPQGHFIHRHGPRRLSEWGLLDRVGHRLPAVDDDHFGHRRVPARGQRPGARRRGRRLWPPARRPRPGAHRRCRGCGRALARRFRSRGIRQRARSDCRYWWPGSHRWRACDRASDPYRGSRWTRFAARTNGSGARSMTSRRRSPAGISRTGRGSPPAGWSSMCGPSG